jgi:hypothetical protein
MALTIALAFVLVALLGYAGCSLTHAVRNPAAPTPVEIAIESRMGPAITGATVTITIAADMRLRPPLPTLGPSVFSITTGGISRVSGPPLGTAPPLGTLMSRRTSMDIIARAGNWTVGVTPTTMPAAPAGAVSPIAMVTVPAIPPSSMFEIRFSVDGMGRTTFEHAG